MDNLAEPIYDDGYYIPAWKGKAIQDIKAKSLSKKLAIQVAQKYVENNPSVWDE